MKKLTREEKVKMTKEGICWKCKSKLQIKANWASCPNCGVNFKT
jgi:predicted RNA-binding Zn-ribbon protein involved in translation (DUF1610 family)